MEIQSLFLISADFVPQITNLAPRGNGSCETAPKSTTLPQDLLGILSQEDMGQQNQWAPSQPITAHPTRVIRLQGEQTGNRDDPRSAFESSDGNGTGLSRSRLGPGSWIWTSLKE